MNTSVLLFLIYHSHSGSLPRMESKLLQSVRRVSEYFFMWCCRQRTKLQCRLKHR